MTKKRTEAMMAGIVLLVIGIIFILERLEIITYSLTSDRNWAVPIIILVIAILQVIKSNYLSKLLGLLLLIIGGIFILDIMGIISWIYIWNFWGAIFVALAIFLFF